MNKNFSLTDRPSEQLHCFLIYGLFQVFFTVLSTASRSYTMVFFTINLLNGIVFWTYFEYHLHRFWTHTANGNSVSLSRHMNHHHHPGEIKITLLQRFMYTLISGILFALSLSLNSYFTIITGFIMGFTYSCFSHWMLHQRWSRKIFPRLHQFHIHHHCKYPDKCFGFTTIFWDKIFGTVPPKSENFSNKITDFYYHQKAKTKKGFPAVCFTKKTIKFFSALLYVSLCTVVVTCIFFGKGYGKLVSHLLLF